MCNEEKLSRRTHFVVTTPPVSAEVCENCEGCSEGACPKFDLCGRTILYVGGRTKLCNRFRALVEDCNGEFLHHDGGLHDKKMSRLGKLLGQADIVLCPIDCISHNACLKIKRHCKENDKPLSLLRRSSVSAFARGLEATVA